MTPANFQPPNQTFWSAYFKPAYVKADQLLSTTRFLLFAIARGQGGASRLDFDSVTNFKLAQPKPIYSLANIIPAIKPRLLISRRLLSIERHRSMLELSTSLAWSVLRKFTKLFTPFFKRVTGRKQNAIVQTGDKNRFCLYLPTRTVYSPSIGGVH